MTEISLNYVKQVAKDTDRSVDVKSSSFKTAVVLLSSLNLGPNVRGLTKYTGYGRHFIRIRAKRLFDFGVWTKEGKVQCSFINGQGTIHVVDFWLHVMLAEGTVVRVGEDGKLDLAKRKKASAKS